VAVEGLFVPVIEAGLLVPVIEAGLFVPVIEKGLLVAMAVGACGRRNEGTENHTKHCSLLNI
jgi:hypothetical protein